MILREERGSALVLAVSLLSLLTLLATVSLMAGGADLLISTRLCRERAAFYAAESGLEQTLRELELNRDETIPAEAFFVPWPAADVPVRRWRDGPWELSRRLIVLPDVRNADGDAGTSVVLFNRSFGYAGSPRATGGYPVFQILVTAAGGETRQAVVAEAAPVTCAPPLFAAWTAGGPLTVAGDVLVDGREHLPEGETDSGLSGLPAVLSRGAVRFVEGSEAEGRRGEDGLATVTDPEQPVPANAVQALNAGDSLPRPEDLPPPPDSGRIAGIVWSRGSYSGPLDGEGILLVHNPGFDPAAYEASRLALESGVFTADYDPAYSHLDPARQPAALEILRGGMFHGIVIADAVGACEQEFTLRGAILTLSRSPQRISALAALRVLYTPAAVERAGCGPLTHMTAFRPLPATESRLE